MKSKIPILTLIISGLLLLALHQFRTNTNLKVRLREADKHLQIHKQQEEIAWGIVQEELGGDLKRIAILKEQIQKELSID